MKRGKNKTREQQDVLIDVFFANDFQKPGKDLIRALEEQFGIKNLQPHYTMIANEWRSKGFGRIDQRNHLPSHTMKRIHSKKNELGIN